MDLRNKKNSENSPNNIPLGSRQRNLLAEDVHIEEELLPTYVRGILLVVTVLLVLFLAWAHFTVMQEVARANGEIIPYSNVKLVQHLDGGIVSEILVEERRRVADGDLLLRMDGSQVYSDLQRAQARLASLGMREERLLALTENREPDLALFKAAYPEQAAGQWALFRKQVETRDSTLSILERQLEQQSERLHLLQDALDVAQIHHQLTQELLDMRMELASQNLVSRSVLLETRRAHETANGEVNRFTREIAIVKQEQNETRQRITDTTNLIQRDALAELGMVRAELAEVKGHLAGIQARVARLEVRAPDSGYVQDLRVLTRGQVVQPGELLMQIVPDELTLMAEVRVQPRDVGFLREGQTANLRVSGYDYARFGHAPGKLSRVSAFSIIGEDRRPYFKTWVTLDKSYIGEVEGRHMILPGMSVEAEISIGQKSVLSYLLRPVVEGYTRTFGER